MATRNSRDLEKHDLESLASQDNIASGSLPSPGGGPVEPKKPAYSATTISESSALLGV